MPSPHAISLSLSILVITTQIVIALGILLVLATRFGIGGQSLRSLRTQLTDSLAPSSLQLAWLVAIVAMSGSLYYSEVAHFTPCNLCWYQRIAVYPMVVLLGLAVARKDWGIGRYTIPINVIGIIVSIYHMQLELFPQQKSLACSKEVSCHTRYVWELNYVSLPMMAGTAGLTMALLAWIAFRTGDKSE